MDFDTSKPTPKSVYPSGRTIPSDMVGPGGMDMRKVFDLDRARNEPHRHYFLRIRETIREPDEETSIVEYEYKCLCGERVIP
jgi:hypothetical protein